MLARLRYYHGQPGDIQDSYLQPLTKLQTAAQSRIKIIESANRSTYDASPLCHYKWGKLQAENLMAYFIAEDLARGNEEAKLYRTYMQQYTDNLEHLPDELEKSDPKDCFRQKAEGDDKNEFLDTVAYARLILEATKPVPDLDVIKQKVIPTLEKVVADRERTVKNNQGQLDIEELRTWRLVRAHLTAAREFVQ